MLALVFSSLLLCSHGVQFSGERGSVPTRFETKLAKQISDIPRNAERARAVYDRLEPLLERYKGGMPSGFLAAIANFESGGKMSSRGDASLGEVGIFQVTRTFPPKVGLPAGSRFNTETNVFLGALEYQIMAVKMFLANPAIPLGTEDNWKLSRLAFSVGPAGTRKLLELSGARSWRDLVDFVDRTGGVSLGRQSPGKVWFRVKVIDVLWRIGLRVRTPFLIRSPVKIPNPPEGPYTIPEDVAKYMPSPMQAPFIVASLGALYYAVRTIT